MSADEYVRLLAHLAVIEHALVALAQRQPATALDIVRAGLARLVEDGAGDRSTFDEALRQVAQRLLDDLS